MARNNPEDATKTRTSIVSAARNLFAEKGFNATTISDICHASGYTRGALFHHFKSKEVLFEKIWTDMEVAMDTAAAVEVLRVYQLREDAYESFMAGCRVFLEHVSRPDFQQIVYIDGPSVLGMKEWIKRDANMGMRNLSKGSRFLAAQGYIPEEKRDAFTVLAYGALQAIAKTATFPEASRNTSLHELFTAFEEFVRKVA